MDLEKATETMDETGTLSYEQVLAWIRGFAGAIAENRQYLTELDSAIGDADHGTNMNRGFQAVLSKLPGVSDKDIGAILKTVGMTLVSTVGGAGGPLYGTLFFAGRQCHRRENGAGFAGLGSRHGGRDERSGPARQGGSRR